MQRNHLSFGIAMVWRKPQDHNDETCWLICLAILLRLSVSVYPDLSSAIWLVQHSDDLTTPENMDFVDGSDDNN